MPPSNAVMTSQRVVSGARFGVTLMAAAGYAANAAQLVASIAALAQYLGDGLM